MLAFTIKTDIHGQTYLETAISGKALLTIPQLNKSTAFDLEERHTFNLIGKLPNKIETLEDQAERAYLQYQSYKQQINRNTELNHLLNTNQVLFYRLVQDHLEEMLPTIYTPIVSHAVQAFHRKFTEPRGLYIAYPDRDQIEQILDNRTNPHINLIVVSDGEGVLGIGDQGVGAMAIPVAKLMVYTAIAGIDPLTTLPIMLDAGTNNTELLNDPFYFGWRHPRLTGDEYAEFIDKFITAVKKKFPHVFLHWEDFGRTNAYKNLITYRESTCSFNDDIQGTAVAALATVLAALQLTQTALVDQRIVVFGAGTAGMGITDALHAEMVHAGLSVTTARNQFWLVDQPGLLSECMDSVTEAQRPYLRSQEEIAAWKVKNSQHISLLEVITHVKPTILIGTSARPKAFDKAIVTTMAQYQERPIILPLSNPTERCEATPTELIEWTQGKVICATGSPFDDVIYQNRRFPISQCNNYLAFPGIGLGVISVQAKRVTDSMLRAASVALSHYTESEHDRLLPSIAQAKAASRQIAIAVATTAITEGLVGIAIDQPVEKLVDKNMWKPHYLPYRRIS